MKRSASRQYTIRNIPDGVDRILRHRALDSRKSFNQVVLEALVAGVGEAVQRRRDLSKIVGSMSSKEAARIEEEVRLQHRVDAELWQ